MKEFLVYTGLRILLFVASLAIVLGVWLALSDEVPLVWAFVIALAISGVASYLLLRRQREALAQRVEQRAQRMTSKFEQIKSREDVD